MPLNFEGDVDFFNWNDVDHCVFIPHVQTDSSVLFEGNVMFEESSEKEKACLKHVQTIHGAAYDKEHSAFSIQEILANNTKPPDLSLERFIHVFEDKNHLEGSCIKLQKRLKKSDYWTWKAILWNMF